MPIWKEIQQLCALCQGTGKIIPDHDAGQSSPAEIDCPVCNGEGYKEWGRLKEG
mgnify:CR=1 FL=1